MGVLRNLLTERFHVENSCYATYTVKIIFNVQKNCQSVSLFDLIK